MSPTNTKPPPNLISSHLSVKPEPASHLTVKSEPVEIAEHEPSSTRHVAEYDEPTDLSMEGPTDLSSNSRHINIVCSPDPPITSSHH